jgi:hypothetical protein
MNFLHIAVTYLVLQKATGHVATTLIYELSKYLVYVSYCSVCVTLTTGYSYIFKNQTQIEPLTRLDSIDFEVDSDKEDDFILVINKMQKKE